ncbi:MAG: XRE family transcriptional regulator [Clostridia bacterium]|nr:XRE family transcriptional regulator [Clostridia bacterium]
MEKRQVYISGPLTNSSKKELYELLGEEFEKCGFSAYIPHQYTDPVKNSKVTPEKVYQTDYRKIIESSLLVAYVGEPSLEVGQEIQIAAFHQIPILLVFEKGAKVSRMTLGTPGVRQTFQFETLENLKEWVPKFMTWYAKE